MERMDLSAPSRPPAAAPLAVPDQRPTADAAAIARDPRPHIPLPIAPVPGQSLSQTAQVTRNLLAAAGATDPTLPLDKRVIEPNRTLKPYGVSLLPVSSQADKARIAEAKASEATEAEARAVKARTAADDARAEANRPVRPDADATKGLVPQATTATAAETAGTTSAGPPGSASQGRPRADA